ncbi:hypothetical protein [Cohaesibacter intestini]|uniref:hypothetical protein n=1 Tax=Cohaesibacter intestini TaxID=2211145 RepID=UPI000DEB7A0E|nr:hypothetical protein [Cohaesibacter intestini]
MSNADHTKDETESSDSADRNGKASDDRQARLSKALRDNLRRRKAQVRARKAQDNAGDTSLGQNAPSGDDPSRQDS